MPSKRASRTRRRPTSPSLPLELIAKILEYLRVYDGLCAPPKDYGIENIAASALISRVWHRAANQELYRYLTIQVKASNADGEESEDKAEPDGRCITTNSHVLKAALLQFPHLGAATRRVTISTDEEVEKGTNEVSKRRLPRCGL